MKQAKILMTLAVSAALLAACGGGGGEPSGEAPPPAAVSEAPPAAAPAAAEGASVTYASLTGDAARGEKLFVQCSACHVVEEGVNRVGPSLHGIIGRTAGTVEGFRYSEANKTSGIVWTEEQLFTYLENPQATIKGTIMAFAGLKDPQDRADVIAYLKTQS